MGAKHRKTVRHQVQCQLDEIRTEITTWYLDEKLSSSDIRDKLKERCLCATIGQVNYAIHRFDLVRPHNFFSPRHKNIAQKRVYSSRKCEHCGTEYVPAGLTQIFCSTCSPNRRFWRRIKSYGVGKQEFDAMLTLQSYECGICHRKLQEFGTDVDHDHVTNVVRGLLCHLCNLKLTIVEDDEFVKNAQMYLTRKYQ